MDPLLAELPELLERAATSEALVRPLLATLRERLGVDAAFLTSIDRSGDAESVLFASGGDSLHVREGEVLPSQAGAGANGLRTPATVAADRRTAAGRSWPPGAWTFASAPVSRGDGSPAGALCIASAEPRGIADDAKPLLRLFAALIGQHLERDRLRGELRQANATFADASLSDPLTGLPNRRALERELGRMLERVHRDDRALMVAFVDLAGCREIHASCGQAAGDRVLASIARALEGSLRGGDLVARTGVYEFVVAGTVPRENADGSAGVLRTRLEAVACGRFDLGDGQQAECRGASVGVVMARTGEVDAGAVLARAEHAVQAARAGSTGTR